MLTPAPKSGKHAALSEGLLASPVRSICSATTSCLRVSENEPSRRLGEKWGQPAPYLCAQAPSLCAPKRNSYNNSFTLILVALFTSGIDSFVICGHGHRRARKFRRVVEAENCVP